MLTILKKLIPTPVKIGLRSIVSKPVPSITFEGVYGDLQDIQEANDGYDNNHWLNVYKETVINKYNDMASGIFKSEPLSPIYNLYSLLVALIENNKISILDFGGGFGTNYLDISHTITGKEIEYTIVDRTETIARVNDLPFKNKIIFSDKIPANQRYQLVYCGSVLQYLPDYKETLSSLAKTAQNFFFITNNFMGNHETFATKQVNMKDKVVAYWIFNKNEIVAHMLDQGFILIHQSYNYQPFHNMHNFPIEYQANETVNLLFKRKG